MNIPALLTEARTIAVVGCSPRGFQTSHRIARYLLDAGFDVIPVNPHHEEILGQRCYPDLQSIPAKTEIDIVNVFRRSEFTADVVRDAAARAEETGRHPAIWTQLSVHSAEAQRLAEEAGFPYIANRCIMVDHAAVA